MTKKDYVLIADAIIEARKEFMRTYDMEEEGNEMLWSVITCMSAALKQNNHRFNEDKFQDYIERNI